MTKEGSLSPASAFHASIGRLACYPERSKDGETDLVTSGLTLLAPLVVPLRLGATCD